MSTGDQGVAVLTGSVVAALVGGLVAVSPFPALGPAEVEEPETGPIAVGAANPVDAPLLGPGDGEHADTIRPGESRFYALPAAPGSWPAVTVALRPTADGAGPPPGACSSRLRVALLTPTGTEPDYGPEPRNAAFGNSSEARVEVTSASPVEAGDPFGEAANGSGYWYAVVNLEADDCWNRYPAVSFPLGLGVDAEQDAPLPPYPEIGVPGAPTPSGATTLPADGTATVATLHPGESRWFAVPVEPGSRIGATALFSGDPQATSPECPARVSLALHSPGNTVLGRDVDSFTGTSVVGASISVAEGAPGAAGRQVGLAGLHLLRIELATGLCGATASISDLGYRVRLTAVAGPVDEVGWPVPGSEEGETAGDGGQRDGGATPGAGTGRPADGHAAERALVDLTGWPSWLFLGATAVIVVAVVLAARGGHRPPGRGVPQGREPVVPVNPDAVAARYDEGGWRRYSALSAPEDAVVTRPFRSPEPPGPERSDRDG
ncbi:hypothetical protein C1701_10025 [Actinoalloteichus sp. AHMU CJ021]|uniref:hypothetical protein n=1 Tax=Actinoalloteichus TaxID=65496 RepID=UPI000556F8B4|nr:hypothetical protein [Actinoalloteichus caeruleus]AUS78649.1 hypothetical protein C1701_10025 [Actinoalloteichus sp. AHMU CJ021]